MDASDSSFLDNSISLLSPEPATPSTQSTPSTTLQPGNSTNFMNIEHTEALQHLEKALNACEATLTETQGMVKVDVDDQFNQQDTKPYTISVVNQPNSNCSPSSPFPAIEGKKFNKFRVRL